MKLHEFYIHGGNNSLNLSVMGCRKNWLMAVFLFLALLFSVPWVLAQSEDPPDPPPPPCTLQEIEDGDCEAPNPKKPRTPKVHPKSMTNWGARETLRWNINKQSFIEGYFDQTISAQDDPYKMESSRFSLGLNGSYIWKGNTFTAGVDVLRNQGGTFTSWDNNHDKTYNVAVTRKLPLIDKWSLTPTFRLTRALNDAVTKDLSRSEITLPLSYALNKLWTIKVLTVTYSEQTYTSRELPQTDMTSNNATGFAYKWSDKSTIDVSLSRQQRYSNQSTAEFVRESFTPKYVYNISRTSNFALSIGREVHSNSTEQVTRNIITPKLSIRWDL